MSERGAAIRQRKRYENARRQRGACFACVHRDRVEAPFGRNTCRRNLTRQHPACETDGALPRFQFDDTVLKEFADAG